MPELIPVNIIIGDRTYRLKIEPSDEEILRKTVKLINEKIVEFKTDFAGKDMQDFIAMVLIWFATEQHKTDFSNLELSNILAKLSQMEKLMDKALSDNSTEEA